MVGVISQFANFLFIAIGCTIIVTSLYHWWIQPIKHLRVILNRIGLGDAVYGIVQAYFAICELFINYYGESRYEISFLGKWYDSVEYPWLMYACSLPVVAIALLFWIPSI